MQRIIIKNIGPISDVDIQLNKINILMGPQSSGKSTIAKIISYCQWVEKRYILDGKYEEDVWEQLVGYHRLGKTYFSENSFFEYESEFIKISYKGVELKETKSLKEGTLNYKKSKNIYIPSERNFVAAIPNLGKYNETNDNIISLVYDWFTAKRKFTKSNSLPILNLGVDYYYKEESDSDVLILGEIQKEIQLKEGSSGLQSLTPLVVFIEYLTNNLYSGITKLSVFENDQLEKVTSKLSINDVAAITQNRTLYHHTNFIIEEPEQNLFPQTQRDFIYYILSKLNSERNHSLLITTHSPYILYAINNCLMGSLVSDKMPLEEKTKLASKDSWISSDLMNVWEVENGKLRSIKEKDTGTVSAHYFNKIMNEMLNEYYEMLNYYEV
jgi:ABC-type lipoprotein export system ATPase subunit